MEPVFHPDIDTNTQKIMDNFFETIHKQMTLSEGSKTLFASILEKSELPRGHILVKAETVCNYVYYIERGLTRTFYLKDGRDVTDWISTEKTFACSIVSFITKKPDIRAIELLEDSVLLAFHHNDLEKLYYGNHEIERFGRLLVSNGLIQVQQRFDDLHFASAFERYKKLIDINPTLIQRVPLGMIASYLGITQETLSRIRSRFHSITM